MQFTVPKFLEREAKIAFGLTFKKLAVLGGLALIVFVLWKILPKPLVVVFTILLGGGFAAAAFVKIGGQSIPDLVKYFFVFSVSSRTFIWGRKAETSPIKFVRKKQVSREPERQALKIAPESRLRSMSSQIEMGKQIKN